jgi:hypothetical protein
MTLFAHADDAGIAINRPATTREAQSTAHRQRAKRNTTTSEAQHDNPRSATRSEPTDNARSATD